MNPMNINLGFANSALNAQLTAGAGALDGMTKTEGASGAAGVDGTNFQNMSVEDLLTYCQIQMQYIDGDIRGRMVNQQKLNARKSALAEAKNVMEGVDNPNGKQAAEMAQKLRDAASKLPDGDPGKEKILAQADKLDKGLGTIQEKRESAVNGGPGAHEMWNTAFSKDPIAAAKAALDPQGVLEGKYDWMLGIDDQPVDKATFAQMKGDLQNEMDNCDNQSSMRMLRLQSLVSKRQTTIQLITNMISKFNQGPQAIAANMKG